MVELRLFGTFGTHKKDIKAVRKPRKFIKVCETMCIKKSSKKVLKFNKFAKLCEQKKVYPKKAEQKKEYYCPNKQDNCIYTCQKKLQKVAPKKEFSEAIILQKLAQKNISPRGQI